MVTPDTLQDACVRLDLRWGMDFVADLHAELGRGAYARVVEGEYQVRG